MMTDEVFEDWHRRYGPSGLAKDGWMQAQIGLLRNLMIKLEMTLEDKLRENGGVFSHSDIRDILRELLYGGYPNPAEAEIRIQLMNEVTDLKMNAPPRPRYFGYTTPDDPH